MIIKTRRFYIYITLTLICYVILGFLNVSIAQTDGSHYKTQDYESYVAELQYTKINDFRVAYHDTVTLNEGIIGKPKETIVMLHGIPSNSWMFRKLFDYYQQDYRIIVPDLIGFGASEKVFPPIGLRQQSDIVHTLLTEHLGINKFKLIVHDFGGAIAWQMMNKNDIEISDMVILNTFLFKEGWNHNYSNLGSRATGIFSHYFSYTFFKFTFKNMFMARQKSLSYHGYLEPFKQRYSERAFVGLYREIPDIQKNGLYKFQAYAKNKLENTPKIIIWGKHDPFLDSDIQANMIANWLSVKDKDFHILDNGKHFIADENAEQIISILNRSGF